jgi:FAD/FMN-containing dehydrogenase
VTTAVNGFGSLADSLSGDLVLPGDPAFSTLRKPVLGGLEEPRPRAVARCATTDDVAEAVSFARRQRLPFALRSGGHSFADFCATDGLLIDLGWLDTVRVDGDVVTLGPGTRMAGLADELSRHGRTVPVGWCPTVAVGGSVLGGGYGPLSRRHGLGCDHLVAAQVVLADGRITWVDEEREPELFWALRGAGAGNFCAVTAMVLRTRSAPRVARFVHRWRWRHAASVIDEWQRWAPVVPDDVNAELVLTTGGPDPDSEPQVVLFGVVVEATAAAARPLIEEFVSRVDAGDELGELSELSARVAACHHSYAGMPAAVFPEPGPPDGVRPRLRAVKSEFFQDPLPREAIEALVATFLLDRPPGEHRELELVPWGGAYGRVVPDETAFAHRDQHFLIAHSGMVGHRATDQERTAVREWVRRSWQTVHPWGSGAVYPNYPDPELVGWQRAYYGNHLERLTRVKARYDPDHVFRFPQSLPDPR